MSEILCVALDIPINKLFHYYSPDQKVKIGARVLVPFGRSKKIGIVVKKISSDVETIEYEIKDIIDHLDEDSIISSELLETCIWASAYYHHPIGQVIFNTLTTIHKKNKDRPKKNIEINSYNPQNQLVLNDEQLKIHQSILKESNRHGVHVIRGVTGSGKTETYISLSDKILARAAQVLVLVPEINLTPQTIDRFKKYLPIEPITYHSRLTPTQKFRVWEACKNIKKLIVIGTRSSVFLPFINLGLVVVDEEHDSSYKQTEMFRYNGRDIGILRSKKFKCPIVLGSATPSFETIHNIRTKKYKEYLLRNKFHSAPQPIITIVDTSIEVTTEGISNTLQKQMNEELKKNNKIILFIGRRGFSNTIICSSCKTTVKCKKCDVFLTYHRDIEKLICHQCEYSCKFSQVDNCCKEMELIPLGIGTQRIESRVKELFPDKKILRVDSDSINSKKSLESFYESTRNNKIDIFIGTQMIVKGHDFDKVSLVGIINVDAGLYSTDFRGLERTGQLITQVSGRSGRQKNRGKIVIQSNNPNHKLLQTVLKYGYDRFSNIALTEREMMDLPPYSHIGIIKAYSPKKNNCKDILYKLTRIQKSASVFVYGPSPSFVSKKRGNYYYQILVGSKSSRLLSEHISRIELYLFSMNKKVNWSIDIDPIEQ